MSAKSCPNCQLVHPASALRCECGYDFRQHRQVDGGGVRQRPLAWSEEPALAVLLLAVCWPMGLVLVWKNDRMTYTTKALLTLAWFVVFATLGYYRIVSEPPVGP